MNAGTAAIPALVRYIASADDVLTLQPTPHFNFRTITTCGPNTTNDSTLGSGARARGGRPGRGTKLGGENRYAYLAEKAKKIAAFRNTAGG